MLTVKDIMYKKVNIIELNSSVLKAAKIMAKTRRGYVIVTKKGKPVGILTDSDLIERIVAKNKQPSKVKIKDVMTTPVITTTPDESIVDVSRKMRKNMIKRIPVVKKGKIIGIVTQIEISSITPEFLSILEDRLKMKEFGEEPSRLEEHTAGICDRCGNYSEDLVYVNGQWLCESCRRELELE